MEMCCSIAFILTTYAILYECMDILREQETMETYSAYCLCGLVRESEWAERGKEADDDDRPSVSLSLLFSLTRTQNQYLFKRESRLENKKWSFSSFLSRRTNRQRRKLGSLRQGTKVFKTKLHHFLFPKTRELFCPLLLTMTNDFHLEGRSEWVRPSTNTMTIPKFI